MRMLAAAACMVMLSAFTSWTTDFDKAKSLAEHDHKYILLSFSGSDWCGPCIKLHHDLFEDKAFIDYAAGNLVLLNADFPRQKKNQLSKLLQAQNEKLADTYNVQGSFPLTVLLDAHGKVLKTWEGVPKMSGSAFVADIKTAVDAVK